MLALHGGSLSKMLLKMYPQHPWDVVHFKQMPTNYWTNEDYKRGLMKVLEKKLKIVEWEDWYSITKKDIIDAGPIGASKLLGYYGGSPSKLIMSMYPQNAWNIFGFRRNFTWNAQLIQSFLNHVSQTLQISSSSWRTLSTVQLKGFKGGSSLIKHTGSLYEALR